MNWVQLAIRAARLGTRKYGRYQFATESFIYAAIPTIRYEDIDIEFKLEKEIIVLTLLEFTIEIDGAFEIHKILYPDGRNRTFTGIDELIHTVRNHYDDIFEEVEFALN